MREGLLKYVRGLPVTTSTFLVNISPLLLLLVFVVEESLRLCWSSRELDSTSLLGLRSLDSCIILAVESARGG